MLVQWENGVAGRSVVGTVCSGNCIVQNGKMLMAVRCNFSKFQFVSPQRPQKPDFWT